MGRGVSSGLVHNRKDITYHEVYEFGLPPMSVEKVTGILAVKDG